MKPLLYNMAEGNLNYLGDSRGGDTGVSGQLLNIAEHPFAFGKMLIQEIFSEMPEMKLKTLRWSAIRCF